MQEMRAVDSDIVSSESEESLLLLPTAAQFEESQTVHKNNNSASIAKEDSLFTESG